MFTDTLTNPISITGGRVAGVISKDGALTVYKGIPFAAPPVGVLRWREPQPVQPWDDVLIANQYGPACMQPMHSPDHFMAQFGFADVPECGISENCLYLNVWAPRNAKNLPVIVWAYGGGHRVGSGSHPVSDGSALAKLGAVVVSINYRLGGLGYLAHPLLTQESGFSGNYACLDVIAALKWVQQNITALGGNADNVTVFGQSAGAALINIIMASPLAKHDGKPLFHRAIVHSAGRFKGGPMGNAQSLMQAEQDGVKFIDALGAKTLEEMRLLPADKFYGVPRQWNPIIDGHVLREPVQAVFERGEQLPVSLLVGFTRDDATPFPFAEWHTQAGLQEHIDKAWSGKAARLQELYPFNDDASAKQQSYAIRRDISFAYQCWRFAELHQQTSHAPVYLFEFAKAPPLDVHQFHGVQPTDGYGAYHGAELYYVFNTLQCKAWPWDSADQRLAEAASRYWVNFSAQGNPSAQGLPVWPEFSKGKQAMILDANPHAGAVSNQAQLEFFTDLFNAK
ncbi:MAG: carboxylesterase family protein [Steroidobacteraceae bacterium]